MMEMLKAKSLANRRTFKPVFEHRKRSLTSTLRCIYLNTVKLAKISPTIDHIKVHTKFNPIVAGPGLNVSTHPLYLNTVYLVLSMTDVVDITNMGVARHTTSSNINFFLVLCSKNEGVLVHNTVNKLMDMAEIAATFPADDALSILTAISQYTFPCHAS